jgi:small subunit ribosomal protein S9
MVVKSKEIWTVGRRKTAVARLKLTEGTGKITVNHIDIDKYVTLGKSYIDGALSPLSLLNLNGKFDLMFNVKGGGISGQLGAMKHALARALAKYSVDNRPILKKEGLLTRDPRMVERKKYGRHKARRGTQFSKR